MLRRLRVLSAQALYQNEKDQWSHKAVFGSTKFYPGAPSARLAEFVGYPRSCPSAEIYFPRGSTMTKRDRRPVVLHCAEKYQQAPITRLLLFAV